MTIRGHGFRSRESVRVSAAGRQWRSKAGARGSFVLTLRGANPCRIVRIVAVGSDGSRAIAEDHPGRRVRDAVEACRNTRGRPEAAPRSFDVP